MSKKLNTPEKFAVMKELEQVCRSDDEFAVYEIGITDKILAERLTEQLGFGVSLSMVGDLRRRLYGNFRAGGSVARDRGALATRVDAIEAVVFASDDDRLLTASEGSSILDAANEITLTFENFRKITEDQNRRLDDIRQIVEIAGTKEFQQQQIAKNRIVELLAEGKADRNALFQTMRGEGFDDQHTQAGIVLLGCVMHGQSIRLQPGPVEVVK